MEKKYLYRMAFVALWMAPLTSLQAAKAVEERHVALQDNKLRAEDGFHHIGTVATLDRAKDVKDYTVANWREADPGINWNAGYTTADEAKLGGVDKFAHDEFPKHPVHGLYYADEGGTLTGKKAVKDGGAIWYTNHPLPDLDDPTYRGYVDKWEFNG